MTWQVHQTPTFAAWHKSLNDPVAEDAVTARLLRMQSGLLGDTKSLGGKVAEARIDVGPGYRVYFTRRGKALILLLSGSDKRQQQAAIVAAQNMVKAMDQAEKAAAAEAAKQERKGPSARKGKGQR